MSEARALLDRSIDEKTFQYMIIELARLYGWMVYHPYDSRRSTPGFPDLTLVRPAGPYPLCFFEVKTERGRVSKAQQAWIDALDGGEIMQDYIVARVVRPSDWPEIEALLSGQDERMTA